MSSAAWRPVVERLAIDRRVIAFDLPGFGGSPMLAPLLPPTPALLAEGLGQQLQELNIALPVDLVGNSLGGYVALEAAKQGTARSVVALSPAGLWAEDHHDRKTRLVFAATRTAAVRWPLVTRRILMTRPGAPYSSPFLPPPVGGGSLPVPLWKRPRSSRPLLASTRPWTRVGPASSAASPSPAP